MLQNVVEPDRPLKTMWRMRMACWITMASDTRSEYVILIAFPRQQWLGESVSVFYIYIYTYIHIGYSESKYCLRIPETVTLRMCSDFQY